MDPSKPVTLGGVGPASPKSSKPMQSAPPAPSGPPNDTELLVFALTECKTFFGKLATTIQHAAEEGKHPATLLKGEGKAAATPKEPKVKRKPSAFNIFVSKKCEQMRAKGGVGAGGPENNALFGQAAAAWTSLSDAQKQAYTQMYVNNSEDPALDDLPEPLGGAAAPAAAKSGDAPKSPEKKRKKPSEADKGPEAEQKEQAAAPEANPDKKKKKRKKSGIPAVEG